MMKSITFILLMFLGISACSAQTKNQFYADVVAKTSEANILKDLTTFENFGIKNVGSEALTQCETWITSRYKRLGYTDIVLQPFSYKAGTSHNIIVTKTGTKYPNTFIVIDAHYDTINGPGTNDNGTGTILIMELARLLKDIDTEYSIKFIHFSGEEDGLIGSNYYVKNTVIKDQLDIKLVFNIDEVGGVKGKTNDTVVCERDESQPTSNNEASAKATTQLANYMRLYSNLKTEIANAYASDYMPFEDQGFVITGLFEKHESPMNHTKDDDLAHMDVAYVYEITKGALGAALEFAVAIKK
ncbi:M28 family metallopeptidase [Psychroserpens sp. SPM9]|uniref:M28 family metallopeptidase n=1 Tax=Psychroserpens sp. SPM9 TaxID=2975598 RepID=UPI0021A2F402|nr:M20/M25/M40 family metallo-hydrolase [Psychroserpens sp. SPM9]MDG5492438.1 M20/M25/M40 family metallo-hydrolase [Psychroserpens sp. SPM9]